MFYQQARVNALYEHIEQEAEPILMKGGKIDPFLTTDSHDTRMAVALLVRFPDEICKRIETIENCWRTEFPEQYYYPRTDYHLTVLDILRGEPGRECPPENVIVHYGACIQQAMEQIGGFEVQFNGLSCSSEAVLVKGAYTEGLEQLRQMLRQSFRDEGLKLEERYETYACHSSIIRLKERISNPTRFLKLVSEYHDYDFGTFRINDVELSFHNWYDSVKKPLGWYHGS